MADLEQEVDAAASGDPAAFRRIVLATSPRLVRLAARIMGNLEDGEDVVQDAFVKAHQALLTGRFDKRSRLDTWLYRIVTNAAIDALRSGKRHPRPSDTAKEVAWDGASAAEARVALVELDSILSGLPPDQRAALVLKAVEGLSASEIADVLGITEGAVEQRLVRARASLKEWSRS